MPFGMRNLGRMAAHGGRAVPRNPLVRNSYTSGIMALAGPPARSVVRPNSYISGINKMAGRRPGSRAGRNVALRVGGGSRVLAPGLPVKELAKKPRHMGLLSRRNVGIGLAVATGVAAYRSTPGPPSSRGRPTGMSMY